MEGTCNDHLVQLLTSSGLTKLKHIIKGIDHMPVKHLTTLGHQTPLGRFVPVSNCSLGKEMLSNFQSKPPLVQLCTILTHHTTGQ